MQDLIPDRIVRLEADAVVLDLRTVLPEEEAELLRALAEFGNPGSG